MRSHQPVMSRNPVRLSPRGDSPMRLDTGLRCRGTSAHVAALMEQGAGALIYTYLRCRSGSGGSVYKSCVNHARCSRIAPADAYLNTFPSSPLYPPQTPSCFREKCRLHRYKCIALMPVFIKTCSLQQILRIYNMTKHDSPASTHNCRVW